MNEEVFIDTSAFYTLMDRSDRNHSRAADIWPALLEGPGGLFTSNYVIVETFALLQNRIGFDSANVFRRDVLGPVRVLWVDGDVHRRAVELWLSFGRRKLSLVDCASFALMRRRGMDLVFCFDSHFMEHGFSVLPRSEE